MATSDVRKSILEIVNVVQRKLAVNVTSSLTETIQANLLLDLLNDVIDEVSDMGDWQQMFREVEVTAISSVGTYEIKASAQVKNIYEIVWDSDVAPLEVLDIQDIRRLQRLASHGTPRQFAVVGVSGANPLIRVHPIPTTAATFDTAFYKKPRYYTTDDGAIVPGFPAKVLEKGLYAKALLEEAGGEPTEQSKTAYAEYARVRSEALNRFTADTGTDTYFTPTDKRYS